MLIKTQNMFTFYHRILPNYLGCLEPDAENCPSNINNTSHPPTHTLTKKTTSQRNSVFEEGVDAG